MYGVSLSSPSRTIALWPAYWTTVCWSLVLSAPGTRAALRRPRLYSASVIFLNSCEPWLVNWSVTMFWPVFGSTSVPMPDSTRSFPVSCGGPSGCWADGGKYLNRYQYLPVDEVPFAPAPMQLLAGVHQTASRFAGSFITTVFAGRFPFLYGKSSCWRFGAPNGGVPCTSLWNVCVFVTFLPLTFVVTGFFTVLKRKYPCGDPLPASFCSAESRL